MRLVSSLWLDPTDGDEAHVPFTALEDAQGLIALTGGPSGPIDRGLKSRIKRTRRKSPSRASHKLLRLAALCRDPAPRARRGAGDRA